MDLTKTRLQLSPKGTSLFTVAGDIVKKEGFSGLYAGLSASVMRQAVYGTARIGLHRAFSDKMKADQGGANLSALQSSGSAMLSGAIASVIGTPFDVSLVRMQADGMKVLADRRGYTSVFNAIARIAKEEGVANLWQGFMPTAMRAIAMNVGMMASYDQIKQAMIKAYGDNLTTTLSSSAMASTTAVVLSLPFDMMKTRLQNMKADATGKMPYNGVVDCAVKIFTNEGPLAFWRGLAAYYARTGPRERGEALACRSGPKMFSLHALLTTPPPDAMIILVSLEQFNTLYKKHLL